MRVYQKVYEIVRQIPSGQVATYGQIAAMVDGCTARMAGYAMASVREEDQVPWHRVINSKGEISIRASGSPSHSQRYYLEQEGVEFNSRGKVDLKRFRWNGEEAD